MRLPQDDIRIFNDSLDRYIAQPDSLDDFYARLIGRSETVAAKFEGIDLAHQKRALRASLYTALLAADGNEPAIAQLEGLRDRHRELDIVPELYDDWLDCLIESVRACVGFLDARTERAWRAVLAVAIDLLRDGAGDPP